MQENNNETAGIGDYSRESVPVVKVWSVRGIEYAIMSFMLWAVAAAVSFVAVAIINGVDGFSELSGALALLIVSLPIFAFMFLRLKKAEMANPALRRESSKRRFSQITQIVAFGICFFSALSIVSLALTAIADEVDNAAKSIGSALALIIVWGVVFYYYWRSERR